MTIRARNKRVTFMRPFTLEGLEGVHPCGTYSVETRDERTGPFSFLNGKRTSTWIRICRNPGIGGVLTMVNIDPLNLAAALSQDAMSGVEVAGASLQKAPTRMRQTAGGPLGGGP